MNFNLCIFLLIFLASACGVKSPPIPPKNRTLPSYIYHHMELRDDGTKKSTDADKEKKADKKKEGKPQATQ